MKGQTMVSEMVTTMMAMVTDKEMEMVMLVLVMVSTMETAMLAPTMAVVSYLYVPFIISTKYHSILERSSDSIS